jgi:hypothetical protein
MRAGEFEATPATPFDAESNPFRTAPLIVTLIASLPLEECLSF